eukprot:COSAG02_NODE_6706_length_3409_cov_1.565257_5_plen_96_part_00
MDDIEPFCEASTEWYDEAHVVGERSWGFARPNSHSDGGNAQRGEGRGSIREWVGAPPAITVGQPYRHARVAGRLRPVSPELKPLNGQLPAANGCH